MDDISTDFMIRAQIRIAAREGVPITIVRHGHDASGTIVLKINKLDGTARVLTQARYGDDVVWNPVSKVDPMPDRDAEECMRRQSEFDPDAWLVEIEDRQGRLWFPGKIIS
jgi:hypothetical protein